MCLPRAFVKVDSWSIPWHGLDTLETVPEDDGRSSAWTWIHLWQPAMTFKPHTGQPRLVILQAPALCVNLELLFKG